MSSTITETYYNITITGGAGVSTFVASTANDGVSDASMLNLAEVINTWKTTYPSTLGVSIAKVTDVYTEYNTDLTANPAAFD